MYLYLIILVEKIVEDRKKFLKDKIEVYIFVFVCVCVMLC